MTDTPSKDHLFEPLKIAVEMLINSSKLVQSWITRLIAINGALFSAVGLILSWHQLPAYITATKAIILLICAFGALATAIVVGVIKRQNTWQVEYVRIVRKLQKRAGVRIQPAWDDVPGGTSVETAVYSLGAATFLAWIALGGVVIEYAPK